MSQEFNEEELAQLATSGGGASIPPGSETNAIIDYYCRQHMWRHVTKAASEALAQRRGDERETKFWRAIGYAEEGSYTEAIRELEPLQNVAELALATTAALINTHKLAKVKDKDALEKLKEKLKTLSKTSDDRSLVVAGRYFWHADKAKQARQCIEKVLTKSRRNIDALTILGWINLTSGNSRYERKCLTLFDTVIKLTNDKKDIGSLLGRARYHEKRAKYDKVLEDLNTIIVMWPDFRPAVVEKARILMIMNNWEESVATAHRVLRVDKDDIDALRLHVLYLLTRESRALTIASRLTDLTEALDRTEPKNHRLYYEISQLCARLTNRRRNLLQQTLALIERACKLDPVNSAYITEQGYQLMLLEEYQQASMCFNEASKLDEGNLHALHGRIKCKILQQNYKEAEQELEFLQEIQSSIGSNADLKFLDALLAWNKDHNEPKAIACLQDAITEHNNMLKNVAAGYEYFIAYNPEFVLEAVNQLMQHIGTEPMQPGDPPNQLLTISIKLLNELTELVPGLLGAQLLLSKVTFIAGEFDASERALVTCLKLEPQCAPAHIIQAQICLARENYKQCSQSLEQARSLDFEVRNTPVYHLLKSRLLEASGQTEEALKTLEAAMELPGVKRVHPKNPLPLQERISLFLELASIHAKLQHLPEATKIMSDARHEFKDTSESVRITIADADLAIKRRDFDTALNMLRTISQDSPHYTRAKMKMAEIYLSYRKNKKLYTACFTELAQTGNTVHSYLLLGEAFMKIQEPEKAIQAYEDALKLNPEDPILASRIGRALITTHDYARAVQYYETAAKGDPSKVYLFHELAQLYLSLKHYDQALRVVGNALALTAERKSPDGVEDIQSQMYDVTSHSIAADVHQGAGDIEGAKNSLTAAWSLQSNVLASLRAENPDAKREQRDIAASLCYHLAELYLQSKMEEKAIQFYNEALKYNDSHEKSRAALARLHLINNELDACQHQCVTLMRIDPNNREASMMLADLMFRKNEHEAATYHFQQLLEKNPTRYEALNKLIQLLRRAGRLSDAPRFLKLAEKFNPHASSAAGLHYCKGLYHWYTNDPREALIQFNYARKDGEWGRQAIMNMIEIYLNPDNMDLFQETAEAKGDNSDHIAAAEKLLKELTSMGEKSNKYIVLESYALMASKQKPRIEKALSNLMALATSDRDHVPSLLGMANAYMLLGQPPKARNQLKRISKMKLDPEYAQDFERAWLMLAEMYIQVSKFEFATELCKKTLSNNKSNAKAWEQLGMIMEKEQAYRDASDHYEHAWRFMNESSPSIGFKLAFNYLKAKRYVEAIDVCHKVLTQYPEYPKIRKEILEKARQALRP